ncbi:MAG: hypothetical protein WBG86_17345 [Polyangiales bacterium]
MNSKRLVLACLTGATFLVGCGDTVPAAPSEGGVFPPPVVVTDGGMDGGAGGGGGTGGTGGDGSLSCEDLPFGTNRFDATLPGDVPLDFDPQVVFSAWQPDSCAIVRNFALGFNADGVCSDVPGDVFEIVIPEQQLTAVLAIRTFSIASTSVIPSTVRLYTTDDTGEPQIWGNCANSSGILNFLNLATDPTGTNTVALQNLILTDCRATQSLPRLTVTGTIQIAGPPECDSP